MTVSSSREVKPRDRALSLLKDTALPLVGGVGPAKYTPSLCIGLNLASDIAPGSVSQLPARRRSRSRASLARLLRQQMTIRARMGNPRMQETIGITIVSGATVG
uniref:Histidinol-phosphate aminotransferase 1 n=1 Tax=Lygus hesperus TaxID=30085 RepID=A0A0A9X3L1_LYGHE